MENELSFGEKNQGIDFSQVKESHDWEINRDVALLMNKINQGQGCGRLKAMAISQLEIGSMLAVKAFFNK